MPLFDSITLGLIVVNVVFTLVLVVSYLKSYRAIASKITLGLLVFAGAFLIENLLNLYFYNSILAQGIFGITTFHFAVNLIELVALGILAWITYK